jgi:catechol 2,3-dioxygenase-like lactoylglutathione lyase family enzyme
MESVIDDLVSAFENGTVSRRRFVQTLAMIAAGSPVAAAVAKSAAAAPAVASLAAPWKTVWLDHISFQVSDYKKSVDFYTSLMGWRVTEDTGTQATLDINGIGGIIIRSKAQLRPESKSAGPGVPLAGVPAAPVSASSRPPITGVIDHISWGVQPWDTRTVQTELERRHLEPVSDMGGAYQSFHVKDPDGWDLQISNQTKR